MGVSRCMMAQCTCTSHLHVHVYAQFNEYTAQSYVVPLLCGSLCSKNTGIIIWVIHFWHLPAFHGTCTLAQIYEVSKAWAGCTSNKLDTSSFLWQSSSGHRLKIVNLTCCSLYISSAWLCAFYELQCKHNVYIHVVLWSSVIHQPFSMIIRCSFKHILKALSCIDN